MDNTRIHLLVKYNKNYTGKTQITLENYRIPRSYVFFNPCREYNDNNKKGHQK